MPSAITSQMQALQQQIQQLQQQLQDLQRQVDLSQAQSKKAKEDAVQAQAQARAQAQPQSPAPSGVKPTLSANHRPGICSADGENCIELTSRVHFDVANYVSVHPQQSTGPHSLTDGSMPAVPASAS